MTRLTRALIYGVLSACGVIGVAALLWAAQPTGSSVIYTAPDTVTMPTGTTFIARTLQALNPLTASGSFTAATTMALTGVITPPQITSSQNDYNPTGLSTASGVRLSTNASWNITGLAGGAAGRIILFHNVGAQNLVFVAESAASAAANRFDFPGDLTLIPKAVVLVQYDGTSLRWRTSFPSLISGPVSAAYVDLLVQGADVAAPAAGLLRLYSKSTGVSTRDSAGNIVGPFGPGGGGGSGAGFIVARVATTGNITLSGEQTIDGVLTSGSIVLVKNQSTASQNGVYTSASAAWSRLSTFDTTAEFALGLSVYVADGTSATGNKDTVWHFAPPVAGFTLGTTAITFAKTGPGPTGELIANRDANSGYPQLRSDAKLKHTQIGSFAQHAALSNASQITVTARQMGIEGSGVVNLTSVPQLVAGLNGDEVELIGTHATNTVQLDNGDGVRLCGNTGSLIIGLNGAKPLFRYNGTLTAWEQIGCPTAQQAFSVNPSVAMTTCGNAANPVFDGGSGNKWEACLGAGGAPTWKAYCLGSDCPQSVVTNLTLANSGTKPTCSATIAASAVPLWAVIASSTLTRVEICRKDAADVYAWTDLAGSGGVIDRSVRVSATASQSIVQNVDTAVILDDETCGDCFDTDNMHNSSTNPTRITFTTSGKYTVACHGRFEILTSGSGATLLDASLRLNGTTTLSGSTRWPPQDPAVFINTSTMRSFTAGDYVEFMIVQNGTVSILLERLSGRTPYCTAIRHF